MMQKRIIPVLFAAQRLLRINTYGNFAIMVQNASSHSQNTIALRSKKCKSDRKDPSYFSDSKQVRVTGGKGGDGCISFLQLWCNERAGPDGGDGGNGGHVIFQASTDVRNLNHITSIIRGSKGENGNNKDCHGKNAQPTIVKVPVGTVIRDMNGCVVGDLYQSELMFVAARGGAGGKGNHFFATSAENSPKVCEYGPAGEDVSYVLELRSMADIGLIGFPNAGKSTILNAITRANSKVAPYAFTTLRPHIGVVQYDDYKQLAVADLPGLIPGSCRNKGLGIQFLKHVERCAVLMFVLDAACDTPWKHYDQLMYELSQFSNTLAQRPQFIVANKMDQFKAKQNLQELQKRSNVPIVPISAKRGSNLVQLLSVMRQHYEQHKQTHDTISTIKNFNTVV